MKKSELTFSVVLVPLDYIMILLAGMSAYFLRYSKFYQENIREIVFDLPFNGYFATILGVGIFWVGIFALTGLYTIGVRRKFIDEFSKIFVGCSAGLALITFLVFFKRELFDSRFIVLAAWILAILYVSIGRFIMRKIQQYFVKRGYGIKRVVVIGNDKTTKNIIFEIENNLSLGFKIVKFFEELNESVRDKIGNMDKEVDEVILADPNISRRESLKLLDICNELHITYKYAADIFNARTINVDITMMNSIPVIEIKRTPLDGWGRVVKRIFDIFGSLFFIILLSPVMIIAAIAIKLDSRGPIFFTYSRIGEQGKPFTFIKFRSMTKNAHKLRFDEEFLKEQENMRDGTPMMKFKNDPRITRVGKFIRKTSIDELPNFFCSLIGTMSLVGPRPHEPEEVEKYQKRHKKVLTLKPGITGLAQISGRSDLDFEDEVKLDTYYIENWSLKLDLQILFKTPFVVLRKRVRG
ncbi:sugar transferase [Patescibacteria group bacterium]|nr:sugar transferase [Patescibacteria group bacterium]MBU4512158.1 sugar transferase [Patescibacteria group bacterium]MCG2693038.1 sugar transferase [Candidatus Parcubacteria bacterium]